MQELSQIAKTVAEMPIGALVAFVVLAGFGLAAYAIHAVLVVANRRH
jgi:hypothetical protein